MALGTSTHLLVCPVFREGKENEPYFKENHSEALPRSSWTLDQLASSCIPHGLRSTQEWSEILAHLKSSPGSPFLLQTFYWVEAWTRPWDRLLIEDKSRRRSRTTSTRQFPLKLERKEQSSEINLGAKLFSKPGKMGPLKINYCQNGRVPIKYL